MLVKQFRCLHSSSCICTNGHLNETVIYLVFQQLNWNPRLIATVSCVCKWFEDVARRVLWKEFCRTRAPKMMLDLQSSGSHSVDGNWKVLGHFVYRTRFSRTSGKSFLLPQCRTDILYVSDPCEHLDQGEGDIGFFRGIFKSFGGSKADMIPRSAHNRLGAYDDRVEYFVCLNGHLLGVCTLLPLTDSEDVSEVE
ncbi:unnamed protein product [Victoria cruziana]